MVVLPRQLAAFYRSDRRFGCFSLAEYPRGGESIELMRESVELQQRANACLEEIKSELKRR
jgi:hypothetical protein